MSASPNTPQGDELEFLSKLIHDYEERKFPIGRSPTKKKTLPKRP
jgi:hypothetical protein